MPEWRCAVPSFEALSWRVGPRTWLVYLGPALCLKVTRKATGGGFYGFVLLEVDPMTGASAWIEVATRDNIPTPEEGQRWAYDAAVTFLDKVLGALGAESITRRLPEGQEVPDAPDSSDCERA